MPWHNIDTYTVVVTKHPLSPSTEISSPWCRHVQYRASAPAHCYTCIHGASAHSITTLNRVVWLSSIRQQPSIVQWTNKQRMFWSITHSGRAHELCRTVYENMDNPCFLPAVMLQSPTTTCATVAPWSRACILCHHAQCSNATGLHVHSWFRIEDRYRPWLHTTGCRVTRCLLYDAHPSGVSKADSGCGRWALIF